VRGRGGRFGQSRSRRPGQIADRQPEVNQVTEFQDDGEDLNHERHEKHEISRGARRQRSGCVFTHCPSC